MRDWERLAPSDAKDDSGEQRFVNEAEMAEILTDEKLVARLRAGSKQVREHRGRFVE